MAATLLELVNRTRALLREEPISAIAASTVAAVVNVRSRSCSRRVPSGRVRISR